jgi:cytochrome b561
LAELSFEMRQAIYPTFAEVHELLSWALIALFGLHLVGAIKHEIIDEEGVLKRMIPGLFGKTTPPRAPAKGALTAFGSALAFFGLITAGPVIAQSSQSNPPAIKSTTQDANWAVDASASEIRFSGTHDGNKFTGVFESWSASIHWNENTLETNNVEVTIETGSALTGNPLYDNTIDAAEWFNTGTFPSATIVLSNFQTTSDSYTGQASITLKDTTAIVPFAFSLTIEGNEATMMGTTSLSRETFDLGQDSDSGGDWVSLDIDVAVAVKASRITG